MKKKGTLRILLFLFIITLVTYYLQVQYKLFNIDRVAPTITISNDKIFNKKRDNFITLSEKENYLGEIKLLFASSDSNWQFIPFYIKNMKVNKKNMLINLNDTDLLNFFSNNISKFKLKVMVSDNAFGYHNINTKVFDFDIDNKGPNLQTINKSFLVVKDFSIYPLSLKMYDKNKIANFSINGNSNFLIQKKDKKIYNILYFNKKIKNNFLHLEAVDTVDNTSENKIYFLTNKNKSKIKKTILNHNNILSLRKQFNAKNNTELLSALKKELTREFNSLEEIIYTFKDRKYNYLKDFNLFHFKYGVRFISKPFNTHSYISINKNNNMKLFTKSTFFKINKYKKIYANGKGVIVFKGSSKLLGDFVIIKHDYNLFSVHFFMTVDKKIKIGAEVFPSTILGKPHYNFLFKSNYGVKTFFKHKAFDPIQLINTTNIKKVFNEKH